MKKPGPTSAPSASEPLNKFADSTSLDLQRDENPICQHFSMRGYVAEMSNTDPKACIPFDGISENTWKQLRGSLDVPRFRYWRCKGCVGEVVPSSFTDGRSNAEETSLQFSISEREKDFWIDLRASKGRELEDSFRSSEAINMVGNDGEREFLYTSPLELLATVAETVSDHPTLQETCHGPNIAEKDSSFERITAGEGDRSPSEVNDLVDDISSSEISDLVDRDDQRKVKKVRSLKDVMRAVNEKASSKTSLTADNLPQKSQKLSLTKQKKIIHSEVEVQEFVRPQGSRKAKRSCPLSGSREI